MESVRQNGCYLTPILFLTTVFLIASVSSAEEKTRGDWAVTVGLGAFHGPEYEGSDEAETAASPDFEVVWRDRVFLNPDSLGINYFKNDSLILTAFLSEGEEREENLNAGLNGLGDIDASTTLTLGAELELGLLIPSASLTNHNGGTDGFQASVGLETVLPLRILTGNFDIAGTETLGQAEDLLLAGPIITAGLSADWADDNYTSGFFGVTAEQSARSGLPQYTAEAGFKSINAEVSVLYPVNKSWTVQGLVGYTRLIGDAEDSPVVLENDITFVGGFVTYHF